jgi:purine-binding chemotaxis protein CheW
MTAPAAATQVVLFRLDQDLFAADIYAVERVLRYAAPTPIPNVPTWIAGVIDYQNRVVPVIDLRRRFEMEAIAAAPETRILVFVTEEGWIGAVVDAVLEVATIAADQLSPPPRFFRGLAADYLKGLIRRQGRLAIFLDVARLLTTTERLSLQRAAEGAASR